MIKLSKMGGKVHPPFWKGSINMVLLFLFPLWSVRWSPASVGHVSGETRLFNQALAGKPAHDSGVGISLGLI